MDFYNKTIKSVNPNEVKTKSNLEGGTFHTVEIDNPVSTESILNKNVGAEATVGYQLESPNNWKSKAYLSGSTDIKNFGEIDSSVNIDFENVKGWEGNASYDLNDSLLTGSITKGTYIGNTDYKVNVGGQLTVDGEIKPTFRISKSFKRGGLLDKNRGWQNLY